MLVIVTGGSGSGKSVYAEQLITKLADTEKYYLATMKPFGEEGKKRVERHQKQRQGRDFITVEQYTQVGTADIPSGNSVLLECMSNLVANEMFDETDARSVQEICRDIVSDIKQLYAQCEHLVIVTNEVGDDGRVYGDGTMEYIRQIGHINAALADMADTVIEAVYGIAVYHK